MNFEDWTPEKDRFLKPMEIEIHNEYHQLLSKEKITRDSVFSYHRLYRIKALHKALSQIKETLSGDILEVGAGDAWCSAYIFENFDINHIHTMEINKPALEHLIPKVFDLFEVPKEKSTLVLGSFNDIRLKNNFNYVIAMGALHHSANLYTTYKNIYNSLKPGGWLIAQEPMMANLASNNYFFVRESEDINFKNFKKVKNSDRSDIFYRECEHRTAAFHTGFNFNSMRFLRENEIIPQTFLEKMFNKPPVMPHESLEKPNNFIIYAQKPLKDSGTVVTNWEEGLFKEK